MTQVRVINSTRSLADQVSTRSLYKQEALDYRSYVQLSCRLLKLNKMSLFWSMIFVVGVAYSVNTLLDDGHVEDAILRVVNLEFIWK